MASNLCDSEDEDASCHEADLTDPVTEESNPTSSFEALENQEDGDFLFMACADWENVKDDPDIQDSQTQALEAKRKMKLQRKSAEDDQRKHGSNSADKENHVN